MAGLLDDIFGSDDPSTADPNTGLTQAQRRAIGFNSLGQIGAVLLAAGQPMYDNERGRILAQLGNVGPNIQSQILNAQQQRILSQRGKQYEADLAREKRITDDVNAELPNLPPELRLYAQANPVEFAKLRAARKLEEMHRKPSETELKLQLLKRATGGNEDTAAAIMSGVLDVKSDGQGGFVLVNKATGTVTPLAGTTPNGAARYGIGGAGAGAQAADSGQSVTVYPNASVPQGLPYRQAFGPHGALSYIGGRAEDVVHGKMQDGNARTNEAIAHIDAVNNEVITALQESGVDGSPRLKASHERIVSMLPKPAQLLTGPSHAAKQYGALLAELDKEIQVETQNLNSPGTPAQKSKSAERVRRLAAARDNVATVLSGLSGQQRDPGVPPPDDQYEYRRNPETGRLQRRPRQ